MRMEVNIGSASVEESKNRVKRRFSPDCSQLADRPHQHVHVRRPEHQRRGIPAVRGHFERPVRLAGLHRSHCHPLRALDALRQTLHPLSAIQEELRRRSEFCLFVVTKKARHRSVTSYQPLACIYTSNFTSASSLSSSIYVVRL